MSRRVWGNVVFTVVVLTSLVMLFAPGSDVPSGFPGSDKIVHSSLFLALAVTGLRAGIRAIPLAVGLVGYAAASEVLQAVLPINRDGDVRDAAADVLGLSVGLVLVAAVRRRRAGSVTTRSTASGTAHFANASQYDTIGWTNRRGIEACGMSVEVLTGVLVIILAVATTAMLALGVAGAAGVVRYLRCEQCHRLGMVSGDNPSPTCVHCQHERLLHPMAVRHRAHAAHHPHG